MPTCPYTDQDLKDAKVLLKTKKVGHISFSEGTYQVEVKDVKKKSVWPFLQFDDAGHLLDGFCSCKAAEKKQSCPHLAAAYLKIFNGHSLPIHVRFRTSLWNQLGQIACRRHGSDVKVLKKHETGYQAKSVTGKCLFKIEPLTAEGKQFLEELLFKRVEETEETSLKFSNLSAEELTLWREGRPSQQLLYELSFWSDLAKWWMQLQDEGEKYEIQFSNQSFGFISSKSKEISDEVSHFSSKGTAEGAISEKKNGKDRGKILDFERIEPKTQVSTEELPKWIHVSFSAVTFHYYIAEANWPHLIPSLATVESPLPVHELQEQKIEAIRYDVEKRVFHLDSTPLSQEVSGSFSELMGVKLKQIGDWLFVPGKGFFPARIDPIFKQREIPTEKIGSVLHKHPQIIQKYLLNTQLHLDAFKAQYEIAFDLENQLQIRCYAFEKGDLQKPTSAYFGSWVYIENKGFYLLENLLFDGIEKVIPRAQISEFINRHRVWLNSFDGFHIHVSSIESHLTYTVDQERCLRFEAGVTFTGDEGEFVDFGEWVYLKAKGFFAKRIGKAGALIHPGMSVRCQEITSFIRVHREELESIKSFFSTNCPLEKSGLEIFLNEAGKIVVRPRFQFFPPYTSENVLIFGDFTYVAKEGFYEIPFEKRLPEGYVQEKIIRQADEPFFVAYELEALHPFIISIQKELQPAKELYVRINRMQQYSRTKGVEWLIDLAYETELGSVDIHRVWQAVAENKRYLFTSAGLIVLKHSRFSWLKGISKKRWLKEGKQLRLNTLDWLRLSVFDDVRVPEGKSSEAVETRRVLQELQSFRTEIPINFSSLKSDLRTYQEIGVKWLWFLYCHGLSGLLCDEMGLGKTHQAMGLLAAAHHEVSQSEKGGGKYLIVCPTSVIYHWQELLKRFLPNLNVSTFYGIGRSLEAFQEEGAQSANESQKQILLTSYGTLRSEKKALSKIPFDIAIYDEIQTAKNAHSQTHQALKKIKASMRIGLTGTPIENRLLELKALFDIVIPGYMPTEAHFKELFVNPIEKNQDPEKKALLGRLIRHFILRRKKSEVLLELPEKIEEIAYCDLSDEQRELYRKAFLMHKESLLNDLKDNDKPVPYLHVFALLSTLKQICDHPCMITKQFSEFQKHRSGKWDLFVERLQETRDSGQKLVVFSQYLEMLNMIEAYLIENKINFAGIRGSTRNRKEQLDRFRDDPQCEVFVASLQAVGVGVDLVSASVVIHYDRWWNPARENQATDRVHRIGQNRGVQVFKMVTKGTIEEHIHYLIERKTALVEGIIGFDDQDQIKGLDRQDLLELLWLIDQDMSYTQTTSRIGL
jgi:hypothetical protein